MALNCRSPLSIVARHKKYFEDKQLYIIKNQKFKYNWMVYNGKDNKMLIFWDENTDKEIAQTR